jgi:hypothetical protein
MRSRVSTPEKIRPFVKSALQTFTQDLSVQDSNARLAGLINAVDVALGLSLAGMHGFPKWRDSLFFYGQVFAGTAIIPWPISMLNASV